jgi:Ser/Thr protein kinase RdoA (MazF antagonist)
MLALRRWPTEHPSPERLRFIHSVLEHAGRHGITILPIPIKTRAGQSFVQIDGHLWELAPWMPGEADYDRSPSAAKLRAAMSALANIHLALANFPVAASQRLAGAPPSITHRLSRMRDLLAGGHHELARAITNSVWPDLARLAREFLAVLPRALPIAIALHEPLASLSFSLQPCLRDIWHDHVLFTGVEVTGIVDCGAIDIDAPACDIARLLGSLVGKDATGWQAGLAAYAGVRTLSSDEIRTVTALDLSGTLLAGCNWIRWIYIDGRRFEIQVQVTERLRRIVARLSHLNAAN